MQESKPQRTGVGPGAGPATRGAIDNAADSPYPPRNNRRAPASRSRRIAGSPPVSEVSPTGANAVWAWRTPGRPLP